MSDLEIYVLAGVAAALAAYYAYRTPKARVYVVGAVVGGYVLLRAALRPKAKSEAPALEREADQAKAEADAARVAPETMTDDQIAAGLSRHRRKP